MKKIYMLGLAASLCLPSPITAQLSSVKFFIARSTTTLVSHKNALSRATLSSLRSCAMPIPMLLPALAGFTITGKPSAKFIFFIALSEFSPFLIVTHFSDGILSARNSFFIICLSMPAALAKTSPQTAASSIPFPTKPA